MNKQKVKKLLKKLDKKLTDVNYHAGDLHMASVGDVEAVGHDIEVLSSECLEILEEIKDDLK